MSPFNLETCLSSLENQLPVFCWGRGRVGTCCANWKRGPGTLQRPSNNAPVFNLTFVLLPEVPDTTNSWAIWWFCHVSYCFSACQFGVQLSQALYNQVTLTYLPPGSQILLPTFLLAQLCLFRKALSRHFGGVWGEKKSMSVQLTLWQSSILPFRKHLLASFISQSCFSSKYIGDSF